MNTDTQKEKLKFRNGNSKTGTQKQKFSNNSVTDSVRNSVTKNTETERKRNSNKGIFINRKSEIYAQQQKL